MEYSQIGYTVEDRVATITLERPDRLNAFTVAMQEQLNDAFGRVDADDDVRAVIVTGSGRGFCAGADLGAGGGSFDREANPDRSGGPVADGDGVTASMRDFGGRLTLRIFECTKPVIAAINGPAVGIGATMTLPMDIRLAAESARFGFVFAGRGIVPEACSSWFLPRVVGISQALEWCYTARVFGAEEAHRSGLVSAVHPDDELLPAARALADEIARNAAPVSVALTRQMLWRLSAADHPMEAHKIDSRAIYELGRSADAFEGVTAFFEKRPAQWKGRPTHDLPEFYPWWEDRPFE